MEQVHDFKNGYVLKISATDSPYQSLGDYDEYLQDSLAGEDKQIFSSDSRYLTDMRTYLEEPYQIVSTGFSEIKQSWLSEVKRLKGTHCFDEQVDFDTIAQHIYKEWWKPLIDSHIAYMEDDEHNFIEHMHNMDNDLQLKNLAVFNRNPNLLTLIGFSEASEYDEDNLEALKKEYIAILQNFEVRKVKDLDDLLDLFILPYFDVPEAESTYMLPDPNIIGRIEESVFYAFVQGNPYVVGLEIRHGYMRYDLNTCDDHEKLNYLLISEKKDNGAALISGLNTYFSDEWYSGEVLYVVPEQDRFKYVDQALYMFDNELQAYVVDVNESYCGFESEESTIENFSYYSTAEPPKYALNFKKLANTQVI